MGRRKISIEPIAGDRNRSATYLKRKTGLFKKAYELAVLTDSEVAVIVFGRNGKLAEFCSGDIDQFLLRYTEYNGTVEKRGPEHFAQHCGGSRSPSSAQPSFSSKSSIDGLSDEQLGAGLSIPESLQIRSPNDELGVRPHHGSWNASRERSFDNGLHVNTSEVHDRRWSAPLAIESGTYVNDLFNRRFDGNVAMQPPALSVEVPPHSPASVPMQSTPGSLPAQPVSPLALATQSPFVPLSPMTQGPSEDVSVDTSLSYQQRSPNPNMLSSPLPLSVAPESYNQIAFDGQQPQSHGGAANHVIIPGVDSQVSVSQRAYVPIASEPTFETYGFENLPTNVQYFPDSSVVLWHDRHTGQVFRSADEGKSWATVKALDGKAQILIRHPYHPRQAFVLSDGTEHWRTTNRGETWQRFVTNDPPAERGGTPLLFHGDEKHREAIIYMGKRCTRSTLLSPGVCHDTAYYTPDSFATEPRVLLETVFQCEWAKASPDVRVAQEHINRIYCIGWEESMHRPLNGTSNIAARASPRSRLYWSDDYFATWRPADLGLGLDARGFAGLGVSHNFLLAALRDPTKKGQQLSLYISSDGDKWRQASFSHDQELTESGYTVLEGSPNRLLIDVVDTGMKTGTLYASDSEGTAFVPKLNGTLRNARGTVDYEHAATISGIALANVQIDSKTKSRITFDDGNTWQALKAPETDVNGKRICSESECTLHLHSLTQPHNTGRVFSSTAPGLLLGVGSVGSGLKAYADCDTFVSTDAGVTWHMALHGPHKYAFGDQGALLAAVPDDGIVSQIRYSLDYGRTWSTSNLPHSLNPVILTTIPDGTALKFLLVGSVPRAVLPNSRHIATFIDFVPMKFPRCTDKDFERFYPLPPEKSCLLGRRQWYTRRRPDAQCIVGDKFHEPEAHEETCTCTRQDYECDIGFERSPTGECVATGGERIPPGACTHPGDTYLGSSGYRKIPGNQCVANNRALDEKVRRPCTDVRPAPGQISHRVFEFGEAVANVLHLKGSPHVFVRLLSGKVFQSADDGSTWFPVDLRAGGGNGRAVALVPHEKYHNLVYIITEDQRVYYSRDAGKSWGFFSAPLPPNHLGIAPLVLHPSEPEWLLWTGSRGCHDDTVPFKFCRTEAYYSLDGGQHWNAVEHYVRKCVFATAEHFDGDKGGIICESHRIKQGSQDMFNLRTNPLEMVYGEKLYRRKHVLFPSVAGFSFFEQYLIVAALDGETRIDMHVSMDGKSFSPVRLPATLEIDHRAYTMLDSVTRAVFLHVTTSMLPGAEYGALVKSNSNGTNYAVSLDNVNRDVGGFVDFEKMQGIDGIALANVVTNPKDSLLAGHKSLVTRITHNDGGHWEALTAPTVDSDGNAYPCVEVGCDLHLQGVTERPDVRIVPSTPAAAGLMLGVGNVGHELAQYHECDMFITRDGGFTWEEIKKGPHRWEIGDQGGLIVLVPDATPTDTAYYSLDQGRTWQSYELGVRLRVTTLDMVPEGNHRRVLVFGTSTDSKRQAVVVHLDFSTLTTQRCVFDEKNPDASDYEQWSPSQQRDEPCLFGRQVWFWRRRRDRQCTAGEMPPPPRVERTCACTISDFECEYNHYRDSRGECVLYPNALPLNATAEEQCWTADSDGFWYGRTNMRKIPFSSCSGGIRPDHGARHRCPTRPARTGGVFKWILILLIPIAAVFAFARWWMDHGDVAFQRLAQDDVLGDVYDQVGLFVRFVVGATSAFIARVREMLGRTGVLRRTERPFSSYHMLASDEDAEVRTCLADPPRCWKITTSATE
ncbi:vacuolar protein sorting/targeting protein PEP1 [Malassezia cuniculi]|uniref:Vacuolar protein sorting/targeting protein PEP1 n=1 Tax=Malassezia cuniculi TaxID=948313 RepID=A0AAF0ESU5_9BASI|nr:vacuolar protein sorting/targeting protein PEP1 [Malassezia cuniculi]